MIIDRHPDILTFQLESRDMDKSGNWLRFIEAIKNEIPKDFRSYDAEDRMWTIKNPYSGIFYEVYRKFYEDPRQIRMEL